MVREISAGAILYFIKNNEPNIILLEQNNPYYGRSGKGLKKVIFDIGPCGRVEKGEDLHKGALREIFEEVGLKPQINTNFKTSYTYRFNAVADGGIHKGKIATIIKTRTYFAAPVDEATLRTAKISEEHLTYKIMPIGRALHFRPLHPAQKKALRAFRSWIKRN